MNLFDALTRYATSNPEKVCIYCDDHGPITYGELFRKSGQYANALLELGVVPGDRVAAKTDKGVASLILYLAVLRAGAIYLPLNTGYTPAEIEYFVGDASPRLLVCPRSQEQKLGALIDKNPGTKLATLEADGGGSLETLAGTHSDDFATVEKHKDDLAAILYTSGTTGRPKGAMVTHGNLLSNAGALTETWRYQASDRLIHALPLFHTHGLFVACNLSLISGASMYLLKKFDELHVMELMREASVLMGVPTFYIRLLANRQFTAESAAPMRLFISGSAPMTEEVHRAFLARTGQQVLERYGMTEANMITSNLYEKRVIGSVGPALPGVEVRVRDVERGRECKPGQVGMIEIRGDNLFKGYWNMPEKTAEEFTEDGFFITGDLGALADDGFLSIVGRSKDLIITGGYNVYPREVEQRLDELPGIRESAVIGIPHPELGEAVFAIVITDKPDLMDTEQLRQTLREDLAAYKVPKKIVLSDALPRNSMGKVQKNRLREWFQDALTA